MHAPEWLLAVAPVLVTPIAADVIVVGSPEAPTIDQAIALAADGDIVLLYGGSHSGFTLDGKGICVVSDGARAEINGTITVRNLAAGQSVALQHLRVKSNSLPPITLDNNAGSVWIEDSILWAFGFGAVALEGSGSASLMVRRSELRNYSDVGDPPAKGTPGVRLTNCTATFFESAIVGGLGGSWLGYDCSSIPGGVGGDGLLATDCELHFVGGSVKGGTGGIGDGCSSPTHCSGGGTGGIGADLVGSSVVLVSCSVEGGAGGPAGGEFCSTGSPGQPFKLLAGSSVIDVLEPARGLVVPSPAREGQSVTVVFIGQPGEFVQVLGSLAPDELSVPSVYGSLLLQWSGIVPLLSATLHASGQIILQTGLPMLDPTLEGVELKLQVLTFPTGGGFVLGEAATLVVLDSAF